jgi:uridine kinase
MREQRLMIAVAGGSGSGKTAVVREAVRRLKEDVCLLDQDSYFFSNGDGNGNFDIPHAIDHELLWKHIAQLKSGSSIGKPRYSFATHQRSAETDRLEPAPIIVLEGLFAYWDERVRSECDLKIFVDAAADLRFIRRLQRDLRERERDIDSIVSQYVETVRPMHKKYSEVLRGHADLILTNDGELEHAIAALLNAIHQMPRRGKSSAANH